MFVCYDLNTYLTVFYNLYDYYIRINENILYIYFRYKLRLYPILKVYKVLVSFFD